MNRSIFMKWGALLCVGALITLTVWAQDKKASGAKPDAKAPPGGDAAMEEMMKKVAPGPEHKVLDNMAGEWNVSAKFWMAPDAEPMDSKGTSTKKWILDGRFIQEDHSSEFMGMKFKGLGITGYDKMKQKYTAFWVDSMGTGMMMSEGDAAGNVITYKGTMDDPMTGKRNKPMKSILTIVNKDKHVLEMHDLSLGEKSKMGEITYTRK